VDVVFGEGDEVAGWCCWRGCEDYGVEITYR